MSALKNQRLNGSTQSSRDLVRIPHRPKELQRPVVMFCGGFIPAQAMESVSFGAETLSEPFGIAETTRDHHRQLGDAERPSSVRPD